MASLPAPDHAKAAAFARQVVDRSTVPDARNLARAYLETRARLREVLANLDDAIERIDAEESTR